MSAGATPVSLPEVCAQILQARIAQDHNDGLAPTVGLKQLHGRRNIGPRGEPCEYPLFASQTAGHAGSHIIPYLEIAIDLFRLEQRQVPQAVSTTLNAVVGIVDFLTGQNGCPKRFDQKTPDGMVMFFESGRAARKRTRCPREIAECVKLPVRLAQNLLRGVQVMSVDTAGEAELISAKSLAFSNEALRFLLDQFQSPPETLPGVESGS